MRMAIAASANAIVVRIAQKTSDWVESTLGLSVLTSSEIMARKSVTDKSLSSKNSVHSDQ